MLQLKNSSAYSALKLSDAGQVPGEIQILRLGKFRHPTYGDFEITKQTLSEMKTNFDKKVRGIDTAFDYFHESDKIAAGWVKALNLREDGNELWAEVDWTPQASQKLSDRELRYFSPDFTFKWTDPENGMEHRNVLFGGGLTNRPFVKEMNPIVASEPSERAQMKLKETAKELELGGPGSGPRKGGGSGPNKAKADAKAPAKAPAKAAAPKAPQHAEREKAEKDYEDYHSEMRAKYGRNDDEKKYGIGDDLARRATPEEKARGEKVRAERLRTSNPANRNEKGPAEKANENVSGVHKVEPMFRPSQATGKVSHGESQAGISARSAHRNSGIIKESAANDTKMRAAKAKHKEVLSQIRAMPSGNLKGLSENYYTQGGIVDLEKAKARIAELEAVALKLSEENVELEDQVNGDKVSQLEAQIAELQAQLDAARGEVKANEDQKKALEEQVQMAEKEKEFNILLNEGKAVAAQKTAFLAGDMKEFIKLSEKVNLSPAGNSNTPVATDDVSKIIKLAEEKEKANPRLSRGEAISMAKKELKV